MVATRPPEALGGIASDSADTDIDPRDDPLPEGGVLAILRDWAVRPEAPQVVRESCQVAIDMWEYENSTDQFNPSTRSPLARPTPPAWSAPPTLPSPLVSRLSLSYHGHL
jgi:hypothetical protein